MNLVISTPMRTGSTWVHGIFVSLLEPERSDFISTADEALRIADSAKSCVLKSHSLTDKDLPTLSGRFHFIRVLRNYKDCIISKALYCRNVRPVEGLENSPPVHALIRRCRGLSDREFLNQFVLHCPVVSEWLRTIVAFERGLFDHTFYYEMLIHNPRDQFTEWLVRYKPGDAMLSRLDAVMHAVVARRAEESRRAGFAGSAGVGQWTFWLDEDAWQYLDAQYLQALESANTDTEVNNVAPPLQGKGGLENRTQPSHRAAA